MLAEVNLKERDRSRVTLIGALVEVCWTSTHANARRQCKKCVYAVRGLEEDFVCLELIYDAIDGVHKTDELMWVPTAAVQSMRVLSEAIAQLRIERLEREVIQNQPKD